MQDFCIWKFLKSRFKTRCEDKMANNRLFAEKGDSVQFYRNQ